MTEKMRDVETFKIYEEGKHRRYTLLFSVNGGAFAVAKLFSDQDAAALLGQLTIPRMSVGMIFFTAVMVADTFTFGAKMRRYVNVFGPEGVDVFGPAGKAVLLLIGLLICSGWFLVSWPIGEDS
jgi:hypothetical protein